MVINVRLATEKDAEDLSKLNQEFNGGDRRAVLSIINSLTNSNELVAVAIMNGGAVGFACAQSFSSFCYEDLQGEITEVYVREPARRKGVATSMISLLEQKLFDRGVRGIMILTDKTNDVAIRTYEFSGYVREDGLTLYKEL